MTDNDMRICERFKKVRSTLKMKQGDFAKEIRTTQGHVSDIENKRKGVSDRVIEIICLKYKISEEWLRNGTGEMFITHNIDDEFAMIAGEIMISDDENFKNAIIEAWKRPELRKLVTEYMKVLHEK